MEFLSGLLYSRDKPTKLNSENRVGNIQALKNDLKKTKELLQ